MLNLAFASICGSCIGEITSSDCGNVSSALWFLLVGAILDAFALFFGFILSQMEAREGQSCCEELAHFIWHQIMTMYILILSLVGGVILIIYCTVILETSSCNVDAMAGASGYNMLIALVAVKGLVFLINGLVLLTQSLPPSRR